MKRIKTLSLTIADLSDIFAIDDPDVRRQADNIIRAAASDPENIDPARYENCHPIICRLIQKLQHRVEMSHRRAAARARREAEKAERKEELLRESDRNVEERAEIDKAMKLPPFTPSTYIYVERGCELPFLWLDKNLNKAIENIEGAYGCLADSLNNGRLIWDAVSDVLNTIRTHLTPYIRYCRCYKHNPLR